MMAGTLKRIFWWLPFGAVPELAPEELARVVNKRSRRAAQLLDVRTVHEWRQGHIKGALNVPLGALKSNMNALPFDRNRPVFAICRSAHRSIPAVRLLEMHGYKDARQLQGGMTAWERRGFPTVLPRD